MADDTLNRLCELVGIQPDYYDIWGHRHQVSEPAKRALLGAMGIEAGDDQALDASLRHWDEVLWSSMADPVRVLIVGEPFAIPLRLPESLLSAGVQWSLTLEDGTAIEGRVNPRELECSAHHDDGGAVVLELSCPITAPSVLGYHRLDIRCADRTTVVSLIICPGRAYLPEGLDNGRRAWGLGLQLYGLRSATNWGVGDWADLTRVMAWAGAAGASLVGINPVHALFPHNPRHCSPYSPSSRQFLNVMHLSVEMVPEFAECPEAVALASGEAFGEYLTRLRESALVDYAGVAELKFNALEAVYRHFRQRHLANGSPRGLAFRAFQTRGGEDLARFALYQALQEDFARRDPACWGWPVWPEAYRRPDSTETRAYAQDHVERIEWFEWLQWLADEQQAEVERNAAGHGMDIGLYRDLAVGVDKSGAEVWMHQDLYATEARVGCPPDDFSPLGQDWGLPPWIPHRLKAAGYLPFIAMLRANMRHAGALRIDHVMGLMRLYWVPPGMKGDQGGYVNYPFHDLLGILALESQRNRCLVVGEDLGTVPDEVRDALRQAGVLSYRLFYFERQQDGHFLPPSWHPAQALVAASTHDLPTLAGFWRGRDIEIRTELHLYPDASTSEAQLAARAEDRGRLLAALAREGLLPADVPLNQDGVPDLSPALVRMIQCYLARSPARLVLVQAEDILGETEQANLPGTVDEHPNWRRKLSLPIEAWPDDEHCAAMGEAMSEERGRPGYGTGCGRIADRPMPS